MKTLGKMVKKMINISKYKKSNKNIKQENWGKFLKGFLNFGDIVKYWG